MSRTSSDETEAKEMTKQTLSHALSHLFFRFITLLCLFQFLLESVSPRYFHAVARRFGAIATVSWIIVCLVSPLYVGFEILWMRKTEGQAKALWIDGALAAACFLTLWALIIYSWGRNVPF
jgi:hypothetical protein